jgi:hypothetical protein
VDVVRGQHRVATELVLEAAARARLAHRLDGGIDLGLEPAIAPECDLRFLPTST